LAGFDDGSVTATPVTVGVGFGAVVGALPPVPGTVLPPPPPPPPPPHAARAAAQTNIAMKPPYRLLIN
jgi:hypothetical protein